MRVPEGARFEVKPPLSLGDAIAIPHPHLPDSQGLPENPGWVPARYGGVFGRTSSTGL
jgi:hypothetical protein